MNPLIDQLPETIKVSGSIFSIDTDFRASIRFELMMLDPEIPREEQALRMLRIYLPGIDFDAREPDNQTLFIAEHADEVVRRLCDFYTGAERAARRRGKSSAGGKRIYDYDFDAAEIYASFLSAYNIDLNRSHLHWWQFHDLFLSLPDDTAIKKIMCIRAAKPDAKTPISERNRIARLQRLYALPNRVSEADRERLSRMEAILLGDGDLSRLEDDGD